MSTKNSDSFVEAPAGLSNLLFADEKQQARFELGVSMMIYKWDALETAVQNSWGGPDSADKRDWITAIVVDMFKNEKVVDSPLIEETLLYAMLDEFDTNVEDGSALPIAVRIIEIYIECQQQNYSTVSELYEKWLEKEKNRADTAPKLVKVEEDPLNPDMSSSDGEDDEENDQNTNSVVEEDVDMDSAIPEPIVDEDGFELVQKIGKGRRY
ncbi:hypothetical protein HG535_0E01960 [Zygotorulaspora mrakii]|uniref:Pre-rRNA-processing protein TSR2 n=1 Tax=Zygotorulaspora mrakii TaxID=42260 RepID=A0A7H9B5R9_ZYGMR|nr:uncharacterized protein HG535_0E01960 [Zygotorulaspora mrakii]QLG73112.1 hypothetical protein HG535_0E01960 [Zygotorulaspora mrakii]